MDNLSGGEKTVAALALLFAIHRCIPEYCDTCYNDCIIFFPVFNQHPSLYLMKSMLHLIIQILTE